MLKTPENIKRNDNVVTNVFVPLLIYYVIHNASVIGGLALLEGILAEGKPGILSDEALVYMQTMIKMAGMVLGGAAVYPYFKRETNQNTKKSLSLKEGLVLIVAGVLLSLGLNFLFGLTGLPENHAQYQQVAKVQFALPLWLACLFYGVVSPIVEEMVFRGIVCNWLGRNISGFAGVAGSALLFGAFHGNLVQLLYASIMGTVLAYVYRKYENLEAPVLIHSAANVAIYIYSIRITL